MIQTILKAPMRTYTTIRTPYVGSDSTDEQ